MPYIQSSTGEHHMAKPNHKVIAERIGPLVRKLRLAASWDEVCEILHINPTAAESYNAGLLWMAWQYERELNKAKA
jgi:hypothetical protein